jgi:hypothetical protein
MTKTKLLTLLYLLFFLKVSHADLASDINQMCERANLYATRNDQEAVEQLYKLTLKSQARLYQSDKYQKLLDLSSEALKEKSNHAEYIKSKINELSENANKVSQYEISGYFDVASHLSSAQMVNALGEFLYDDRNAKPKVNWEPGMDIAPNDSASNSWLAAKALQTMGIKNPPQTDLRGYAIIDSWKLWFEQVKAGNRTFSFEGENIGYRLKKDGTFETLEATAATEINRLTNNKQNSTGSNSPTTTTRRTTWIVFASILAVLAALYYAKFRKVSR